MNAATYYGKNRNGSLRTKEQVLETELRSVNRAIERVKRLECQIEDLEGKLLTLRIRLAQEVEDLKVSSEMIRILENL
jgi:hypothetical protein